MKTEKIIITYKSRKYILNRTNCTKAYYQIGFESDRWGVHIYLLQDRQIRIIINKSIKKSENDYHTQFHYDCYCTLHTGTMFLNFVNDPATCKRIRNHTKWFTIEPMLRELYSQLKEEINALHPFDLIHDIRDLEQFIYREMEQYGSTEFIINGSLRFGIGENAYAPSREALQAAMKEPILLMDLFNGFHVISKDTVIFFLYWLLDRDGQLTVSDGERMKTIVDTASQTT